MNKSKKLQTLIEKAENHDAKACYMLGHAYYNGSLGERDFDKSLKWLNEAKKLGYMCNFSITLLMAEIENREK